MPVPAASLLPVLVFFLVPLLVFASFYSHFRPGFYVGIFLLLIFPNAIDVDYITKYSRKTEKTTTRCWYGNCYSVVTVVEIVPVVVLFVFGFLYVLCMSRVFWEVILWLHCTEKIVRNMICWALRWMYRSTCVLCTWI